MKIFYELTTYNKNNKLKNKIRERCHSFVKPFLQSFYIATSGNTLTDIVAINGTASTQYGGTLVITHAGNSVEGSVNSKGIQVGINDTAVAITDYALNTQIINGTSTGRLEYYGTYTCNYLVSGSTASFDIEGIFKNSSSGDIIIKEVGLYGGYIYTNIPTTCCFIRDICTPTTISDGEWLKVKYTIQVTA